MDIYIIESQTIVGREEFFLSALSAGRREKALRLRNEEARRDSVAAGLLLHRFIGDAPLLITPQGKPYCGGGVFFSLSHSGGRAVLAISDAEIGVDTEKPGPYREGVARRVLTEAERSFAASDAGRFLRLWTRKEAVLKLLGCGLARSMGDFSVSDDHLCMDGRDIYLKSILWDGWWLSAASEKEEALCCRRVDAEECLLSADTAL